MPAERWCGAAASGRHEKWPPASIPSSTPTTRPRARCAARRSAAHRRKSRPKGLRPLRSNAATRKPAWRAAVVVPRCGGARGRRVLRRCCYRTMRRHRWRTRHHGADHAERCPNRTTGAPHRARARGHAGRRSAARPARFVALACGEQPPAAFVGASPTRAGRRRGRRRRRVRGRAAPPFDGEGAAAEKLAAGADAVEARRPRRAALVAHCAGVGRGRAAAAGAAEEEEAAPSRRRGDFGRDEDVNTISRTDREMDNGRQSGWPPRPVLPRGRCSFSSATSTFAERGRNPSIVRRRARRPAVKRRARCRALRASSPVPS